MILICQCISTFVSLFFMSSSENTLSTTTLQVAGFNFSGRTLFSPAASGLLQLPRWKWTCNSWCKSISYFLASASPSPSSSWDSSLPVNTTFHAESKPSFVQVTEEAPSGLLHRQLELPPDRPLRGALPLHHFPHSLHLCLSNEFLKKAPFSWALPLFKTPCPSTDAGLFSDDSQAMTFQVSQLGQLLHCWELLWTLPFFSQESSQEDYSRLAIYFLAHSLFFPFLQLLQIWIAGCDEKLLQDFMTNLLEHSLFLELTLRIESRNFSTKKKHIVRRSLGKLWVLI